MLIVPLGFVGGWEVAIIALVILLLFGGRKIPELMRGIGRGIKSFKEGMKDVEKEIEDIDSEIKK
ncbi:MAG: twin-arginine translocase TatA/TatE family subunit [Candidatus Cryptobacteroides sp.]